MIRVIATFQLKAENRQKAVDLARELVELTRKEEGCAMYDLLQPTDDANRLVILEAWESQEVLDKHSASEHFTRLVPALASLCQVAPVVQSCIQLA